MFPPNPRVPETLGREIQPQHPAVWTGDALIVSVSLCVPRTLCISGVFLSVCVCAAAVCVGGSVPGFFLFLGFKEHFTDFSMYVSEYAYGRYCTLVNNLYLGRKALFIPPNPKLDDASTATGRAAERKAYFRPQTSNHSLYQTGLPLFTPAQAWLHLQQENCVGGYGFKNAVV